MADLTAQLLRDRFNYSPETGHFTRIADSGTRWKAGSRAGCVHKHRLYRYILIDGRSYLEHRLAWLYMTGEWPKQDIDHLDGHEDNNVWSNLREVSEIINAQNQRCAHKGSASGLLGVYPNGKRWMSTITVNKVPKYIGTFDTKEAAFSAYLEAKRRLHEGCTI